jgi:uracil-DNA glycosylase
MQRLLSKLVECNIELILFGAMAKDIKKQLPSAIEFKTVETLHPYNIGFIHDSKVWDTFVPMKLLDNQICR